MTTLLFLLSLLATDCRVHTDQPKSGCAMWHDTCQVDSYYIDTCKMRCDTVWTHRYWLEQTPDGTRGREDSFRVIDCYPDTAVDSGWWFSVPDGKIDIRKPAEEDTLWIFDTPFLRSEMPDLKEMLREWRVEKCYKAAYDAWPNQWIRKDITDGWRDSCRCLYGGGVR